MTTTYYRGWTINYCEWMREYCAVGPDYDADWLGDELGWQDNGQRLYGPDIASTKAAVDEWISDEEARKCPAPTC